VPDRLSVDERLNNSGFNSPVGILAVCADGSHTPTVSTLSVSIPRLEFWPFVRIAADQIAAIEIRFNSPVGILAVCADLRTGVPARGRRVSIPRLEFWPFVRFPLAVSKIRPSLLSIPRLEFWPFVPEPHANPPGATTGFQFPGWNSGRLCCDLPGLLFWLTSGFNSPVGILAVCAPIGGHMRRSHAKRFNSPVGILAVCA